MAGLSRDKVPAQEKFAAKVGVGYSLLSDVDTKLIQGIGAWGEKKAKGKVTEGPFRSTVVVDAKGKVLNSYFKVKAKGHAEAVLEDLKG